MRFEDKKFCQVRTLAERWECSPRSIYRMIESGHLEPWHPSGLPGKRGLRITVASVIKIETERSIKPEQYAL